MIGLEEWCASRGRRRDVSSAEVLAWAVRDPATVARYWRLTRVVPGSSCVWWVGALSGKGHGRFGLGRVRGRTVTVIAHRFGYALAHEVEALWATPELAHGCDHPQCQLPDPEHVRASTSAGNRAEFLARRRLAGSSLGRPGGSLAQARVIRAELLTAPGRLPQVLVDVERDGVQERLW